MKLYRLPEQLRDELKKPLGKLIPHEYCDLKLPSLTSQFKWVVSVGDATTERLLKLNIIPTVQVVDGKEMRCERKEPEHAHKTEIHTISPAGFISEDAVDAIKNSMKAEKPVRIVVDGEEDLFALLFIAFYPNKTLVLYGQPKEGIVAVKVNEEQRSKALRMLKEMGFNERVNDSSLLRGFPGLE